MGYVYVIRHDKSDYYKVGCANNWSQRLKTLQTGNPQETETILHRYLQTKR